MAGKGRAARRAYSEAERRSLLAGAEALGLSPEIAITLLSGETYDVWLNEVAYWGNIPFSVWDYTIGGYQVLKKWLSYREFGLLRRPLTSDEAREFGAIARRIAAIVLLGPALDAQYQAVKATPHAWNGPDGGTAAPVL